MEENGELLIFKNRVVRFWRDQSPYVLEENNRRLNVPVDDEEGKKLLDMGLAVRYPPEKEIYFTVRIPSKVGFLLPGGPIDLVVWPKTWAYNEHSGSIAYLQSYSKSLIEKE